MPRKSAPFGIWTSPITAESLAGGAKSLAHPLFANDRLYWLEGRASEGGRQVVVSADLNGGPVKDEIGPGLSARSRVHEYGGGAYAVIRGDVVFSNDADGRIYRGQKPVSPEPRTPRSLRYAAFAEAGRRILCVRESHEVDGEPRNELVALADGEAQVVAGGHDFYGGPAVSPDGSRIAFLTWDHPRMPWNGTELWVADVTGDGVELVAGGSNEAVVNATWSPDGRLYWISDRSGWWNLYRDDECLYEADAEFAMPLWGFGQASYAFLDDGRIACNWTRDGFSYLGLLDPESGRMEELEPEYVPLLRVPRIVTDGKKVAYVGASPDHAPAVVVLDPGAGQLTVVARSTEDEPAARYLSPPQPIDYASSGRTSHALFYPPHNDDFVAPEGELPPLLVLSHGGPTAQTEPALDLEIQFWTSRGFAVVDVNYGGSTGYGRAYRDLLREQWGVVDLEDCAAAALYLADQGLVDRDRLAIRGGSAGGYTTLCALTFTDVFHAGASYYGVADLQALQEDTHKFESRYEQWLIPEDKIYERSPINFVDRITAPVILFQGLEDPVVPPQQSEVIAKALAERGIDHEYHAYEGEAHGFRKAENIVHAQEAELAFYQRVLVTNGV